MREPVGAPCRVPARMCVVCGRRFPKAELARHTLSRQDGWTPDGSRSLPGRGYYLCSDPACRERFAACAPRARKREEARRERRARDD